MRLSRTFAVAGAVLLLVLLPACASGHGPRTLPSPRAHGEEIQEQSEAVSTDERSSPAAEAAPPKHTRATTSPAVSRSGTIDLDVDSAAESAERVADLAERLGGSVLSQNVSNLGKTKWADLAIAVPVEQFDRAIADLQQLGDTLSVNRSAEDVTTQRVDLDARIGALRTSVARLTELMNGAASTSDLIEAETALSERQQELDSLVSQRETLDGRIKEATIWVTLREHSPLPGGGPSSFGAAVSEGLASVGAFFAGAVIVVGFAVPWLLIAGALAVIVLLLVRWARKRSLERRERVNAPAEDDPPPSLAESAESVAKEETS